MTDLGGFQGACFGAVGYVFGGKVIFVRGMDITLCKGGELT